MPLFVSESGIDNYGENAEYLKRSHYPFPYPLCLAFLGFCLYSYGYMSAKLGYGSNWSLVAFFVGILLCIAGVNWWFWMAE